MKDKTVKELRKHYSLQYISLAITELCLSLLWGVSVTPTTCASKWSGMRPEIQLGA
jgi:hypothetical protein